jgi:G2/mitotic-specific cyclin 3/4
MHYSGYTFSQLRPLVKLLLECCEDPHRHHQAVFNKYCDKRYKRAAVFVEDEMVKGFSLQDVPTVKTLPTPIGQAYFDSFTYGHG